MRCLSPAWSERLDQQGVGGQQKMKGGLYGLGVHTQCIQVPVMKLGQRAEGELLPLPRPPPEKQRDPGGRVFRRASAGQSRVPSALGLGVPYLQVRTKTEVHPGRGC